MKFLKFLHAVNQSLHTFLRHGIVAGCTESTYRTVSLDTYHTSFGSELQEVSFQFLVFGSHHKCRCSCVNGLLWQPYLQTFVTVNFGIQHIGHFRWHGVPFLTHPLLNPAQCLQGCIDGDNGRSIEHRAAGPHASDSSAWSEYSGIPYPERHSSR